MRLLLIEDEASLRAALVPLLNSASYPTTRTVDNRILALRGKIEPVPSEPRFLLTVHGTGYRLVTES